ncbi:MAG TPA: hypothetical protein DEO70_14225 [Bacteroidales bacterium]|nr:MAG: hypothetical protein A2X11_13450 [Bacteroidetes bacterium GWE2_42_24]OFY26725.1 MAG: hypothetical protein A2X09_09980 [Bacteroidetes bacterium GWF2_43_11]HBZ67987.1 hypothetical protein [Bacteroidales bacterium]
MAKTKVLITVKTYPAISKKYEELVCTAGFLEDGTWIRIYPIQFRKKAYSQQYSKYEWIELDLVKNESDFRPESYRPVSHETPIGKVGEIKPDGDIWEERRKIVLKKVHTNLNKLIEEAKDKNICTSLAVFKPSEILDFVYEEEKEREWPSDKLAQFQQLHLFEADKNNNFEVVKKLPYKFSYVFKSDDGVKRKIMIEDWETGQLYWNNLRRHDGDEVKACHDVRKKYFDNFAKTKDLHFFLGTTKQHHFIGRNPFVIIGTFHPKPISQYRLF